VPFDYSDYDISKVDEDNENLGTDLQDCAIIAQTFERGAHSTPTETAIFSTFSRTLTNMQSFSSAAIGSMAGYLAAPQLSAQDSTNQATDLSASAGISPNSTQADTGTKAQTDQFLQNIDIGSLSTLIPGSTAGKTLLDWAKDCIPCGLRIQSFLELNPAVDLLTTLETDLKNKLQMLSGIIDLLKDLTGYSNICDLMNLLSFTCIPDLQRIITVLAALLFLDVSQLDGLIGILQALIAPIFAPILMSLTTLLDKLVLLVVNPLECVITSFQSQITKLDFDLTYKSKNTTIKVQSKASAATKEDIDDVQDQIKAVRANMNKMQTGLKGSIQEMTDKIEEATQAIKRKMHFYLEEIKALLGEFGLADASYLRLAQRKLGIVRLISFIAALIEAMVKGHPACSGDGKTPEQSEIDNFFQIYLNPNGPFKMYVDDEGQIHIDNKTTDTSLLSDNGNVFIFDGSNALDPIVNQLSNDAAQALSKPVEVVMPCLKANSSEVDKINQWIAELSNI